MSEKVIHTQEPWAIDRDDRPGMEWNNHIISVTHPHLTICFMSHTPDDLNDEGEANARRIVACVNACKGISTEMLEHVGTDIMPAAVNYRTLRQQRDQLAAEIAECHRVLLGIFADVEVGDFIRCKGSMGEWRGIVKDLVPLHRMVRLDSGWCMHQKDELVEHIKKEDLASLKEQE